MPFLKKLIKGNLVFDSSTNIIDITLTSAVDSAKTFVDIRAFVIVSEGTVPMTHFGNYGFVHEFLNSTTLRIKRFFGGGGDTYEMNVRYYVLELYEGTVQRGVVQQTSDVQDIILPIDVDHTKTFSIASWYSEYTGWTGRFDEQVFFHNIFDDSGTTKLKVRSNLSMASPTHQIYWQAITLPNATVLNSVHSVSNATALTDITVPFYDRSEHFMYSSALYVDGSIGSPDTRHLKWIKPINDTTLSTQGNVGFACPYISVYRIMPQVGDIENIRHQDEVMTITETFIDKNMGGAGRPVTDTFMIIGGPYNTFGAATIAATNSFNNIGIRSEQIDANTNRFNRGQGDSEMLFAFEHVTCTIEDLEENNRYGRFPTGFTRGFARGF